MSVVIDRPTLEQVKRDWARHKFRRTPHGRANRLGRIAWRAAYLLLFRPSPRVLHGWRRMLLRLFGAQVGRRVRIYPNVKIWAPWNLQLGDDCSIGDAVDCYSVGRLAIGESTTVSQYTFLCTATHDHTLLHFPLVVGEVVLGPHVWVGAGSFVMAGVHVGEGTVVGARSTVLRSLPPWKIAVGTPCRVIGGRTVRLEETEIVQSLPFVRKSDR